MDTSKEQVRQRAWERMDSAGAGRSGSVRGKIPDFRGAPEAAQGLTEHERWHAAHVVKSNPDKGQTEVRATAVDAGKQVYMAVPVWPALTPSTPWIWRATLDRTASPLPQNRRTFRRVHGPARQLPSGGTQPLAILRLQDQ